MRVLVTGAAGLIGSHLVERLLADGHAVVGVDDLSGGSLTNLGAPLLDRHKAQWCLFTGAVSAYTKRHRTEQFDVVYHLAAHVGVQVVLGDPLAVVRDHALDALAVLRIARRSGAKLVIASSSEVYGMRQVAPFREDEALHLGPPSVPRWAYAASKLWVEHAAVWSHREFGQPVCVPRFFNVTGPRQRADTGMVVPSFAKAALSGESLRVQGEGNQVRCFGHVVDVAEWLAALSDHDAAFAGEIVNVGTEQQTTIRQAAVDVARYCWQHYGVESRIEHVAHDAEAASGAMRLRVPDLEKMRRLTGRALPGRWSDIVADVCDWWAAQLGVKAKAA